MLAVVVSDVEVEDEYRFERLRATTLLANLLGLVHSGMNGAGVPWTVSVLVVYMGLAGGMFILVALVAALVVRLHPPWTRIVVRVAASWIVATGLLLLGWAARRV